MLKGNRLPQIRLTLLLGFILLKLPWSGIFAQQLFDYDSAFVTSDGIKGVARFSYYIKDGQRVIDGPFSFEALLEAESHATERKTYFWKGSYKDGVKEGNWDYKEDINQAIISDLRKGSLEYSIQTLENQLKINYKQGYPDGKVEYRSSLFENGKWKKSLEILDVSFQDKLVDGTFSFIRNQDESQMFSINGEVQKGFMNGTWLFHYSTDSSWEERKYVEGVLMQVLITRGSDTVRFLPFPLDAELEKKIGAGASGLKLVDHPLSLAFSDGYPSESEYIQVQKQGNERIRSVLDQVFRYDSALEFKYGIPIGTTRGIYDLSHEEKEAMNLWPKLEAQFSKKLFELEKLGIDRLEFLNDSIINGVNQWKERQDPVLEKIREWYEIVGTNEVIYYNRRGLLVEYAEQILSFDNIFVNGRNKLIKYPKSELEEKSVLLYVVDNLSHRNSYADSIYNVAVRQLEAHQYARQLYDLNETIKAEKHLEDSLYSELPETRSLAAVLERTNNYFFETTFPEQYSVFINSNDAQRQMDIGFKIISELKKLDEAILLSREIEVQMGALDSVFTEYLFDPFTYTDKVPNRVKKKLYDPIVFEMIPQGIERAGQYFENPYQVLKQLEEVRSIQESLLQLRFSDTRKIEKKFKRNTNYDARLESLMTE